MGSLRRCELCSKEAALHCDADSAYLCWGCDAKVHGANFLVARHVRIILCCRCHENTGINTCALSPNVDKCFCRGCSSSDCTEDKDHRRLLDVSERSWSCSEHRTSLDGQTEGKHKKRMITKHAATVQYSDMKVQAILRRWCRHLNLRSPSTVPSAMHLVEKGLQKLGSLFRQKWKICLAASLWIAATLCENQACLPPLKKVEECTGVPSKLIVVGESRLATIIDCKMAEEGWAESDTIASS